MKTFQNSESVRLPQDVASLTDRGVPDLAGMTDDVATYEQLHDLALIESSFGDRALACWGLVARGQESLGWISRSLTSASPDVAEDAAGVLRWIDVPPVWLDGLSALAARLPDDEAADSVLQVLDRAKGPERGEPRPEADELLMGGSRLPFTDPIWFVNAPLEQVADETRSWLGGLDRIDSFTPLREPLPLMLDRLEPWTHNSWKQLMVATNSRWTAIFSQGSDIYTADVVGRRLRVLNLRTHYSPRIVRNGVPVSSGDCAFWLNDGAEVRRNIQASFQSRWTWYLSGQPQDFEDLEPYEAPRIPDRFPLSRLNAYCRALGIERNDRGFYRDEGLLIEQDISAWKNAPQVMPSSAWRAAHS